MARVKKYFPVVSSIFILTIAALLVPWGEVLKDLGKLSLMQLLAMVGLSLLIYLARVVRLWLLLKYVNVERGLHNVGLAYMAAQPVTLLPAGEMARAVFLKRYAKVSTSKGMSAISVQAVIEATALLIVSLAAALAVGRYQLEVLSLLGTTLGFIYLIKMSKPYRLHRRITQIPFINIGQKRFHTFFSHHRSLLEAKVLVPALALSLIPVLAGTLILLISAQAAGASLSPFQAVIGYALPVVLGGLSFLPGGLGANEGSSIGILALFGVPLTTAIAITLLVRIFTWGSGFVYGGLATIIIQILKKRRE